MAGRELDQHVLALVVMKPEERARIERAAAVHAADRVGAEHPHPFDDEMPRLAGQIIAKDPAVRQKVHDLIDALGLRVGLGELAALQGREVGLEADLITATDTNQRLEGGGHA